MTEITRVPLQPIAKGALAKVWIGIAAVALAAGGIAWASMPLQAKVETITPGKGPSPTADDVALINYVGRLPDGTKFDEGKQSVMPLSGVVPGFAKALEQMQRGGKYKAVIPAKLAYGDSPPPGSPIPPNTDLTFDIELLDFIPAAEYQQRMQMMQQLQQMQAGQGAGAPGAAPAVPAHP